MNRRTRAQRPGSAPQGAGPSTQPAAPALSLKAMRAEDVRVLQSTAGNRAARTAAQRSMHVGAAGDAFEQEADSVAREVVAQSGQAQRQAAGEEEIAMSRVQRMDAEEEEIAMSRVQRQAEDEEEIAMSRVQREAAEEEEIAMSRLQRSEAAPEVGMEGGAASADTSAAIESARGGGSPLPGDVRREMEGAFGADFGNVRVHEGGEAADLNQRLAARAFTTGSDIFVGQGGLNASSRGGKELLAHELTHVVQQGGAPAARKTRRTS